MHVHGAGALSRSALGIVTGLNRSTVGSLVTELHERGLVDEVETAGPRAPGRPSPMVRPAPDGVAVLAADVEVDSLACAVVGLGGAVLTRRSMARSRERLGVRDTLDDLVELFASVRRHVVGRRIIGVGIAVVGVVRRRDGFVHLAPNLGWRNVPLAALVADRTGLTIPVFVGNEANLGGLGEHVRGAGVGVDDLIYLSGEVGVGAGIIVSGDALFGAEGYAGEVGHVIVNPEGLPCRCGSRGCWETEIGERAILRAARMPEQGGKESIAALFREAAAGNPNVMAALAGVARWLGIGMAGLANIFNPRRIVMGGLFSLAYPYISESLRSNFDAFTKLPAGSFVDISPARLGEQSSLIGAAELAFSPLLADPTSEPLGSADGSATMNGIQAK